MRADRSPAWVLVGLLLSFILFFATVFGGIAMVKFAISGIYMAKDSTTIHKDGIDEKPDAATGTYLGRYPDMV